MVGVCFSSSKGQKETGFFAQRQFLVGCFLVKHILLVLKANVSM